MAGYNPASAQTGTAGINHQAAIWYDRLAVENLKAHLPMAAACERKRLPERSGKTIQLFMYDLFAANTVPGTEGTVGTGINPVTEIRAITLQQYFDFISFSDLIVETAIDPIVENSATEMGYRAALTVNQLIANEFDVAAGVTNATIQIPDGFYMNGSKVRQAVMSLRGANVRPKDDGMFYGIIHPFAAFDLLNDNTAGAPLEVAKYTSDQEHTRGVQGFRVLDWAGVRLIETTTVPTYSNYLGSGKTAFALYVVGKNAIFTVSLGATDVPGEKNFRLIVKNYNDGSVADPANVIGASVAYNFKFAAMRRPGLVMAMKRVQSEVSIS